MLHNPDLIVLDEPFSGLDPVNTEVLSNIMKELVSEGKYIIMSSHQMGVIEEFCSDLVILNRGKTVLKGNLKKIKDSYETNKVMLETDDDVKDILDRLKLDVVSESEGVYMIGAEAPDRDRLLKELVKDKINVKTFSVVKPSLHEIFIEKAGE